MENLKKFISLNIISLFGYPVLWLWINELRNIHNEINFYTIFATATQIIADYFVYLRVLIAILLIDFILHQIISKKFKQKLEININNKIYLFLFKLGLFLFLSLFLIITGFFMAIFVSGITNSETLSLISYYMPIIIIGIIIFNI